MKVAWPAVRVTGAPRLVTPSLNCTEPVATPAPGAVTATVAVNDTDWPTADGFGPAERTTPVVVAAWFTWWASGSRRAGGEARVTGVDGGDGVCADAEGGGGEGGLAGGQGDGCTEVGDAVLELHRARGCPGTGGHRGGEHTDWPATDGFGPAERTTEVDVGVGSVSPGGRPHRTCWWRRSCHRSRRR